MSITKLKFEAAGYWFNSKFGDYHIYQTIKKIKGIIVMNKCLFVFLTGIVFSISYLSAQTTDQDAEYQKIVKEYTLNRDGSYDFHYRKELKLLTYFSFQRLYGETFIVYNPKYQQLKINEAYTVMADGKKVMAPENAFNEVLPGFARDVAAYNFLREMVVTHTATEIGALITLDYTIHTSGGYLPVFFGQEEIGEAAPVKDLELIIHLPADVTLQYRMLNNRTAPEITEANGQRTYRWSVLGLPALPRTSNQDPERQAMLQFSIAKDMPFAYFAFVNQLAFKETIGPEASKRAEKETKDKTDDLDKIFALQALVIDELKLVDIPLEYTGYKVRPPQEIWQSANATPLEKAILLSKMLVAAGINAYPVATAPNGLYNNDMGNLAVFDDFLVQVNPKKMGRIYLSVNQKQSQNLIYDLLDKTIILLDPAMESMRTFQEKPEQNMLKMEADLKVSADKMISGSIELSAEGIVNPYFRIYKDSSYVKNMLTGDIPGSKIGKPGLEKLSSLKTEAEMAVDDTEIKTSYDGYLFFVLPRFRTGFDSWNLYQYAGSGTTPVKFEHHLWEEYTYKITLPDGYSLFTPPVDMYFKNVLGVLSIKISQKGNDVSIYREFELSHDVVTSNNMDALKEMIKAWENGEWRKIVLKVKE